MLRKIIYAALFATLSMQAASAQTDRPGIGGYSPMRDLRERKSDREIDSAYQSTIKALPEHKKGQI